MDLCFSGFAKVPFVEAVDRLLNLAAALPVEELSFWDPSGVVNRSTFNNGTGVADAPQVLDLALDDVVRVSVRIRTKIPEETGTFMFAVVRADKDSVTGLDGQVYWSQKDADYPPIDLRNELESFMLQAASALRALITLSDEDDPNQVLATKPRILLPLGIVAAGWNVAGDLRQTLAGAGYTVKEMEGGTIVSFPHQGDVSPILKSWLARETAAAGIRTRTGSS